MQEEKILPTLELRENKWGKILALTLFIGITCFMAYDMRKELFKWQQFNPNGIDTIIFLLFLSFGILSIINIFDNRAIVIIEQGGIWKRKFILPFSPMKPITWKEMQYFYYLQKTDKGYTLSYLVIRKRETEKDIKVGLITDYHSPETILSLVRQYAERYEIHDLGEEIG